MAALSVDTASGFPVYVGNHDVEDAVKDFAKELLLFVARNDTVAHSLVELTMDVVEPVSGGQNVHDQPRPT